MLFVSIGKPEEIKKVGGLNVDGVELRLDLFPDWNLGLVQKLIQDSPHPVLLTLRGGSEEKIEELARLSPPFLDLDSTLPESFLQRIMLQYPRIKHILSFHGPLENLDYNEMMRYPAYRCKVASMAPNTNEALKMLLWAKEDSRISMVVMGENSSFARAIAPCLGHSLQYASISQEKQTAPGQISSIELTEIYRYHSLNQKTHLFGLIGDPITWSQGHLYHNQVFKEKGLNALYVKMKLKAEELPSFISLAKEIGFRGLSVTMPLKEKVVSFVDAMDDSSRKIGAINTLSFQNGQIMGTNTDGKGVLDALEKKGPIQGKTVLILGAGGTARAIAFEAKCKGAVVIIANRTRQKAEELATLFGAEAKDLIDLPKHYDILINATSQMRPMDPTKILPGSLVMDLHQMKSSFLEEASRLGCPIISGREMFEYQAARQTAFWLNK